MPKRRRTDPNTPLTWPQKLMAWLLVLAFGAAGAWMATGYVHAVGTAWQARAWTPVGAEILEARTVSQTQHSRSGAGDMLLQGVQVRYRYHFQGQTYISTQLGVGRPSLDNFSQNARRQAQRALNAELTIAWVDPANPARAVLVRELPWEQALFQATFLLFPCGFVSFFVLGVVAHSWDRWRGGHAGMVWAGRIWAMGHGALALPIVALAGGQMGLGGWLLSLALLSLGVFGGWRSWRALRHGEPATALAARVANPSQ